MDFDIRELLEELIEDESWGDSRQDRAAYVNALKSMILNS